MKKTLLPLLLLTALFLGACGSASPSVPAATAPVNPAPVNPAPASGQEPAGSYAPVVRVHMKALTDLGARLPGSPAEAQAAQYIAAAFTSMGYTVETQPFSGADPQGNTISSANVIATKAGKAPQEILVGAHYDLTGPGFGADDDASGVAVMLTVAELLKNEATPYTVRFIAFGANEAGALGASAYVSQMSQSDFDGTVALVDLDSLLAGDIAYAYGEEGPQAALRDWTLEWAFGNGLDLQTVRNLDFSRKAGQNASDYTPFQQVGIPFVALETADWTLGNQDGSLQVDPKYGEAGVIRHTQYDTLDYLDANFPGRVDSHLDLFTRVLHALLLQYEVANP